MPSLNDKVPSESFPETIPMLQRLSHHADLHDKAYGIRKEMAAELSKLHARIDHLKEQISASIMTSHLPAVDAHDRLQAASPEATLEAKDAIEEAVRAEVLRANDVVWARIAQLEKRFASSHGRTSRPQAEFASGDGLGNTGAFSQNAPGSSPSTLENTGGTRLAVQLDEQPCMTHIRPDTAQSSVLPSPMLDQRRLRTASALDVGQSGSTLVAGQTSTARTNIRKFSIHSAEGMQATLIYKLRPSIWDASLFIGTPNLGVGVSSALLGCLILNLLVLAAFIVVIGKVVTASEIHESNINESHFWRATVAHDVTLRNPITGESLASEVCSKKLSTPFSNAQVLNVIELDEYLAEFETTDRVCTGGVMCALALSVWYMTLVEELRGIVRVTVAGLGLPTDSVFGIETLERHIRLTGLSTSKKIVMFMLAVVRMCIVAKLAWDGARFLVFEISVQEILLNTVSLGYILNVDELIFGSLAPNVALALVDRLLPLPLPRRGLVSEFLVLPCLILVPLALAIAFILHPKLQILRDSREALCGGVESSLSFVVAVDAIGIPWAAPTPVSDHVVSSFSAHATLKAKVHGFPHVSLHSKQRNNNGSFMHVSTGDALQAFQSSLKEFRQPGDWAMVDVTQSIQVVGWDELVVLGPDGQDFGDSHGTVYNRYLHHLLGAPSTSITTCAQVPMSRCYTQGCSIDAVVMRQLCPSKCGCDEPTHGTVLGLSTVEFESEFCVSGCAPWNSRKQTFQNALVALPCTDVTARDTFASWALGFGNGSLKGHNESLRHQIVALFDMGGCHEAAKFRLGSRNKICEKTSMPAVCPEACGCNTSIAYSNHHSSHLGLCPRTCGIGARRLCFTTVRHYTRNASASWFGPWTGYACVFPFIYKRQTYTNCTSTDWPVPWCAVTLHGDGVVKRWGDCPDNCSTPVAGR